jgi:hypothetical protein
VNVEENIQNVIRVGILKLGTTKINIQCTQIYKICIYQIQFLKSKSKTRLTSTIASILLWSQQGIAIIPTIARHRPPPPLLAGKSWNYAKKYIVNGLLFPQTKFFINVVLLSKVFKSLNYENSFFIPPQIMKECLVVIVIFLNTCCQSKSSWENILFSKNIFNMFWL